MASWELKLAIAYFENRLSCIEEQLGIKHVPVVITAKQVKELQGEVNHELKCGYCDLYKARMVLKAFNGDKEKAKSFLKADGYF